MHDEGKAVFSYRLQGPSTFLLTLLVGIFSGLMVFMMRIEPDRFMGIDLGFPFGLLIYGALALVSLAICIRLIMAWRRQARYGPGHLAHQRRAFHASEPLVR